MAGSTFGFGAPLDRTNSGANFTIAENIQQHINPNLKKSKFLHYIHEQDPWYISQYSH
jgi:hypothetical protein